MPVVTRGGTFELCTGSMLYDEAYLLAMVELEMNISRNGLFIAGAGWTQLWTRDTAFSVQLGGGLIHPEVSRASLEACIETDSATGATVWLQDKCGHFGGWPNLSDAIVGTQGAWALYLITGDLDLLRWAYEITKNSLLRAERDVYDVRSGLFRGCSSFMESNSGYPRRYKWNGKVVGKTKALSTNMLYYNGYKLGSFMGEKLGAPVDEVLTLEVKANRVREAIRSRLWLPEQGYYAYFEDENGDLVTQMEGLGESLVLLSPEFENNSERIRSIILNTPRTENGIACLWPRFDIQENFFDVASYYHNGRIWPFIQSFWAIAAASHNDADVFAEEFANILKLSRAAKTFSEFYELDGSSLKRRKRQLWSDTGFLSFVYHGLFGMKFVPSGIELKPVKPASLPFANTIQLNNVPYRDLMLDIHVTGHGSDICKFYLDGVQATTAFVPSHMKGKHKAEIILVQGST